MLLIVDGHAYAYRAFHAIRALTSPAGRPTNAIFGFVKMLAKMRGALQPSQLVVVWDGGLSAERLAALPAYKAQRPPMPEDLAGQMDEIAEYLAAAGICSLCADGVEADDLIATLARLAVVGYWRDGDRTLPGVVIASADKDFFQLVSARVGLLNPNDKSAAIWTAAQVREKTGVEPGQIVDWLSLIGDAVDNIPGVPGVGPKTAAELLGRFASVGGLYERLAEVKSERLRAALAAAEAAVRRNRELIRLRDDLVCGVSPEELAGGRADARRLRELFGRWGFRGMAAELDASRGAQADLFGARG